MEESHHGQCLCGAVQFAVHAAFSSFFLCHCTRCQKDTGSAHAANLFAMGGKISWLAGEEKVKTFLLSGTRHQKSFCMECGSALPNMQMDGQLLVVPAGCLDGPIEISPNAHICCDDRANWDEDLHLLPKLSGLPT